MVNAIPKSAQLALPFSAYDEHSLRAALSAGLGRDLHLVLTDNARSLMSSRTEAGALVLRLHRIFLDAEPEVVRELGAYLKTGRGKTPLFWQFVRANSHRLREARPRAIRMQTEGRHHDLRAIFDAVNAEYFQGAVTSSITWGRGARRARRRILGSYSASGDTIRINPCLDRRHVPKYYIEFVVYHEMLHADIMRSEPTRPKDDGPRRFHTPAFRQREQLFRHYNRAIAYENGEA